MHPEAKASSEDRPNKPTLLVVDDEEGPRLSLQVLFKDEFNVLLADDGPAGIALAQTHPIDVAVLDIRMAGMSGIEVLERLKFVDPGIEVVMMTAFETADSMRQALRLRACDYINKPFEVTAMRTAVRTALKRRSLASETSANIENLEALRKELDEQKLEQQIVRDRGEIYASIIHDINGPLTIISGLIQIINQRVADESAIEGEELEMVKDRLKRITRQVTNCIEISRRYLSFLRQHPNETVRVWVNQILGDLSEFLRVHPAARSHQMSVQPLAQDTSACINGTDLIQILTNLSLNALQCSPQPHKVEIRGKILEQPLNLDAMSGGAHDRFLNREGFSNTPPLVSLSVSDNGPGIPPETIDKVFQAGYTTQPRHSGTGLGLSIVQRLVRQAHGGLHLHTEVGKGTTFTVYLHSRIANTDPALKP